MAEGWGRAIWRSGPGRLGLGLLALLALGALGADLLRPGDPLALAGPPLLPPFADQAHPFGTDRLGRDLLAGLLHGARLTLSVALSAALLALVAGAMLGALAGTLGGLIDEALMRLADAVQTVPAFLLALAIVAVAGPGQLTLVLAVAVAAWTGPARAVRAEVLRLRHAPFVEASRLLGQPGWRLAFATLLPNALTPLVALGSVIVAGAILTESALSFLGLGDPNAAAWGAMIAEGRAVLRSAPHVILVPGLATMLTVIAVSLLGDGIAHALDRDP